jgi:hypothetical protein
MIALMNLMVFVAFFMYCYSDMYDVMCTAFLLLTFDFYCEPDCCIFLKHVVILYL